MIKTSLINPIMKIKCSTNGDGELGITDYEGYSSLFLYYIDM